MNLLDAKILKDSSSYHLLKKMVQIDEGRSIPILLAGDRFGKLSDQQVAYIEDIRDFEELLRLLKRIPKVSTWDELIAP